MTVSFVSMFSSRTLKIYGSKTGFTSMEVAKVRMIGITKYLNLLKPKNLSKLFIFWCYGSQLTPILRYRTKLFKARWWIFG